MDAALVRALLAVVVILTAGPEPYVAAMSSGRVTAQAVRTATAGPPRAAVPSPDALGATESLDQGDAPAVPVASFSLAAPAPCRASAPPSAALGRDGVVARAAHPGRGPPLLRAV